jgi:hypothetical protein
MKATNLGTTRHRLLLGGFQILDRVAHLNSPFSLCVTAIIVDMETVVK